MLYLQELIITGAPAMVPGVMVDVNTININGNNVTLTLIWGEPFNNLDPIVNYTVSCSGDDTCPPNFTTTDNTTRSYAITNLTPMTNYTFAVLATNSIGSGEAGVVMVTANMRVNIISSTSTSNSITTTARPSKSMITTSTSSIIIISTVIPTVISTNASTPSISTTTKTVISTNASTPSTSTTTKTVISTNASTPSTSTTITVISTNASTPSTSTTTRSSSMDMTEGITITSKFYYCYNFIKLGRRQPHIGICLIS